MTGTLEKTYSQALFDLALEDNLLDTVYNEFMSVADILNGNKEYIKLLTLPTISFDAKQDCIDAVFKDKVSGLFYNFMLVIVKNNRAKDFFKIANEFKNKYNEKHGILEIRATTAKPLSDGIREKLIVKLQAVSGKKITLNNRVDKGIIGGIVLDYNNSQIDASIKSSIDAMRAKINSIIA